MCHIHTALQMLQETEFTSPSGKQISAHMATPMDDVATSKMRLGDNLAKIDHKGLRGAQEHVLLLTSALCCKTLYSDTFVSTMGYFLIVSNQIMHPDVKYNKT